MAQIELPTFEESKDAIATGEATALHIFIYENEPAGTEEKFRAELIDLIAYITNE